LSDVTVHTSTVGPDSTSPKGVIVFCPIGKVALGGGGSIVGGTQIALTSSSPFGGTPVSAATGWFAVASAVNGPSGDWTLTAHVICATVP
jgi:hypothetical protein